MFCLWLLTLWIRFLRNACGWDVFAIFGRVGRGCGEYGYGDLGGVWVRGYVGDGWWDVVVLIEGCSNRLEIW